MVAKYLFPIKTYGK